MTTVGDGCITHFLGTSSAAPMAAGILALVLEVKWVSTWPAAPHTTDTTGRQYMWYVVDCCWGLKCCSRALSLVVMIVPIAGTQSALDEWLQILSFVVHSQFLSPNNAPLNFPSAQNISSLTLWFITKYQNKYKTLLYYKTLYTFVLRLKSKCCHPNMLLNYDCEYH